MDKINIYGIIVGIVGIVLAYISSLRSKNKVLSGKLGNLEAEKSIREQVLKKEEAEDEANSEEELYNALRRQYLNDGSNGDGEGGTA